MKNMLQITQEHLARYRQNIGSPEGVSRLMAMAREQKERWDRRLDNDPAIKTLVAFFANSTAAAMKSIPPETHEAMLLVQFLQAIDDWEQINEKFYAQLQPAPGQTEIKN